MTRIANSSWVFVLGVFWTSAGCASWRQDIREPTCPLQPRGLVYVANGAGDFRATSDALRQVIAEAGLPLQVETVAWSHGYGQVVADQVDEEFARTRGQRLAAKIAARRRANPDEEIYLVAHCAGSAVILAAAESLPPDSVDRIILLAPSVPANYDLRPALRSARDGIDVFYSVKDRWCLGLWLRLEICLGTRYYPVAGRYGFQPVAETPEDAAMYNRLHQHPWQPGQARTGNTGGHYGSYQPGFLRAYILPLLARTTSAFAKCDFQATGPLR
jgi:pimeloyl-ACP methyl ester carboxylesterase